MLASLALAGAGAALPARAEVRGGNVMLAALPGDALEAALRGDSDHSSLAVLGRMGASFLQAHAATCSPLAYEKVLACGLHAHHLGGRGEIHDFTARRPDAPTPDVGDHLVGAGYRTWRPGRRAAGPVVHVETVLIPGRTASAAVELGAFDLRLRDWLTSQVSDVTRSLIILVGVPDFEAPILTRVPMVILETDRSAPGRRIDGLVSDIDVAPTILDWTGITGPIARLPGRSLLRMLDGAPSSRSAVFGSQGFASYGHYEPLRAIRTRDHLLIRDLTRSPEVDGLSSTTLRLPTSETGPMSPTVRTLREELERWRSRSGDTWLGA